MNINEEETKSLQNSVKIALANGAYEAEVGKILKSGVKHDFKLGMDLFSKEDATRIEDQLLKLAESPALKELKLKFKLAMSGSPEALLTATGISPEQLKRVGAVAGKHGRVLALETSTISREISEKTNIPKETIDILIKNYQDFVRVRKEEQDQYAASHPR